MKKIIAVLSLSALLIAGVVVASGNDSAKTVSVASATTSTSTGITPYVTDPGGGGA